MTDTTAALTRHSYAGEEMILGDLVDRLRVTERFAIDIAAGDGVHMSNTFRLFQRGWSGLAVECDPEKFKALGVNYQRFPSVSLARCKVTPDEICSLLGGFGVPRTPGILSLDIDSYDHAVLKKLWSRFRPHIVCAEINEKIPPPIRFKVDYHPDHTWATDHFYGQSISQLYALCREHDYALVTLEFNNAFLVPRELATPAGLPSLDDREAYRRGYLERQERFGLFPWNRSVEHWQHLPTEQLVSEISGFFKSYQGKFTCEL